MLQYLWIGLGGFFGANARFITQQWAANIWGSSFPYGTMIANVTGSFVIAFFLTLASGRLPISPEMRLLVAVGFLGGFTTFSSFSFETFKLFEQSGWQAASINFVGNTTLGLLSVVAGIYLARVLQAGGN